MATATSPRLPAALFVCTANSCRSQMAEGWARALHPTADFASAGSAPGSAVNRLAVRVMAEAGVDIAAHRPKTIAEAAGDRRFRVAITLCDHAQEACPRVTQVEAVHHVPFDDPPQVGWWGWGWHTSTLQSHAHATGGGGGKKRAVGWGVWACN